MYSYNSGFNNHFATEALPNALPTACNSPQKVNYGLIAEQLSGTAFTLPRNENLHSWLYRIRPAAVHRPFSKLPTSLVNNFDTHSSDQCESTPNQLRWSPFPIPDTPIDFSMGINTVCGQGNPSTRTGISLLFLLFIGLAIHVYGCNTGMKKKAMYNSDGDFLIVPQLGDLNVKTEMGHLHVSPGEILVIPGIIKYLISSIRFAVDFTDGPRRGYILEVYDRHFELPDLGPIGSNGLANPRDFLYPVAAYEDIDDTTYEIINKYQGHLFAAQQDHSPFDVVAWHGNYAPFKYDLAKFNTINTVSYDHPDPSIFTVLTVKSGQPGVALADFVIFPPRWMVAENTFRPPYFHRNCMAEFMGLISGGYDAKEEGFVPGGASLHSIMTGHGPDADVFSKASTEKLQPVKLRPDGLAFMFETNQSLSVSKWALSNEKHMGGSVLQSEYYTCWTRMKKFFDPNNINAGPQ
ncbi:hypothetical protein HDV02_003653 [Globomyces sp. JEL0801]|nr:hypothetical protein HDV02_003653 [Globomyces sp. JEL0801]